MIIHYGTVSFDCFFVFHVLFDVVETESKNLKWF